MSTKQSVWTPYKSKFPTPNIPLPENITRTNLFAIAAAAATAISPGWNYTNSKTRSEASPGTAALPARKYWFIGSGNNTKWVRAACTYDGSGNVTNVVMSYSDDNESTYVPMYAEDAVSYVLNLTYDGSSNLTSATWGIS